MENDYSHCSLVKSTTSGEVRPLHANLHTFAKINVGLDF